MREVTCSASEPIASSLEAIDPAMLLKIREVLYGSELTPVYDDEVLRLKHIDDSGEFDSDLSIDCLEGLVSIRTRSNTTRRSIEVKQYPAVDVTLFPDSGRVEFAGKNDAGSRLIIKDKGKCFSILRSDGSVESEDQLP